MFDKEQFIEECRAALAESDAQGAINEIVKKAVSAPQQIFDALGEPQLAGADTIYKSPDLTILNIMWGPQMDIHPHNHEMWAVIGIYSGREDNEHLVELLAELSEPAKDLPAALYLGLQERYQKDAELRSS